MVKFRIYVLDAGNLLFCKLDLLGGRPKFVGVGGSWFGMVSDGLVF